MRPRRPRPPPPAPLRSARGAGRCAPDPHSVPSPQARAGPGVGRAPVRPTRPRHAAHGAPRRACGSRRPRARRSASGRPPWRLLVSGLVARGRTRLGRSGSHAQRRRPRGTGSRPRWTGQTPRIPGPLRRAGFCFPENVPTAHSAAGGVAGARSPPGGPAAPSPPPASRPPGCSRGLSSPDAGLAKAVAGARISSIPRSRPLGLPVAFLRSLWTSGSSDGPDVTVGSLSTPLEVVPPLCATVRDS